MEVRDQRNVEYLRELEPAPPGWRWLDFFGRRTRFEAFLIPETGQRWRFLIENADLVDPVVQPFYADRNIEVTVDATWAVPGTFVVAQRAAGRSPDQSPPSVEMQVAQATQYVFAGLKALDIPVIAQLRHWNSAKAHSTVHTWLLPLYPQYGAGTSITALEADGGMNLPEYLHRFRFTDHKDQIVLARDHMARHLEQVQLGDRLAATERAVGHLGVTEKPSGGFLDM